MNPSDARYIIGIDLGTTNSALSYVDRQAEGAGKQRIRIFKVPQLTGPGEITRRPVLPSFCYLPGQYDIAAEAIQIPWHTSRETGTENDGPAPFVGIFAREHGASVPSRLVASAKSWLCHDRVDRKARILPWGAGEEIRKISPVQATAAYLGHLRDAWNHIMGSQEEHRLEHQFITITVPASFDEIARDLTVEAAAMAGLAHITLLEEPLAAFYSWLMHHEYDWQRHVAPGELILICDVGGGTTDFSLITLTEVDGSPRFERIAVGDHLILGGDNIDLALARQVEQQFSSGPGSLSGDRWKSLCHQCRQAKERILEGDAETQRITLVGQGSRLIAGTMSALLDRDTVEQTVLEGFFPVVAPQSPAGGNLRKGLTEFGLPYEQEPAITRHLGWFLEKHRGDVFNQLERKTAAPDWVLLNGGSLKPSSVQTRVRAALCRWFGLADTEAPRQLENPLPELAVALGAAYYGRVKTGEGVRVGSGSARGYYLGVASPDQPDEKKTAVCLVERGVEEGSRMTLGDRRFEVLTNQPVAFDLYSSSFRTGDQCGDVLTIDDSLTPLPPIQTVVQFGKKGQKTALPVQIEADFTETGTLALWCRSLTTPHRWRLQFQLRSTGGVTDVTEKEVFDEALVGAVRKRVHTAFAADSKSGALEALMKNIADAIDRPRERWPLGFLRSIADELLQNSHFRKTSAEHESRWLNLAGYCLRPGFGDAVDSHRIKKLWRLYHDGWIFDKSTQVRSEWWVLWRRVAGGLTAGQQRQFLQDLTPLIYPKKSERVRLAAQEMLEIWMAAANMERLAAADKTKLGRHLLAEIKPKKYRPQHFWSLARIGARVLLYGPLDRVVPSAEVSVWIEKILDAHWRNPKPVAAALAQMARRTGDRTRDVDDTLIQRIIAWMPDEDAYKAHARYLKQIIPLEKQEETALFGESLPAGIVLRE